MLILEFGQLDRRYECLRIRKPEEEKRLVGSLAAVGQRVPIVVIEAGCGNQFIVIDGYKRIRALQQLHSDTVLAMCWQMAEMEAVIIGHFLRNQQGETPLEEGWLLCEMIRRFGLTLQELSARVGRSVSWVSRRIGLVAELPEPISERVRRGEIVAHAAMKSLLPLARANRRDCVQIAEAIAGKGISSRQLAQLYSIWRDGSAEVRNRITRDPMLFLRTQSQSDEPASGLVSLLQRDLDIITSTARRALRRLRLAAAQSLLLPCDVTQLQQVAAQAGYETGRLGQALQKELQDAQTRYPNGSTGDGSSRQ
jgi:ParB family chromosome partitioning protein